MTIDEALKIVKRRHELLTSYVDARTGMMMFVVKAASELRVIPEVKFPEGGISLFASEVIELAQGQVTIRDLVEKKNPAAVALGRKGGKAIAQRGPEYFRQLQARRK